MTYRYKVYVDTERDGTFASALDDVTSYTEDITWTFGLPTAWEKVAPRATLSLTLNNASGDLSQTNSTALYYNKLVFGTLIKVVLTYDGTDTTMCVLKIETLDFASSEQYGEEYILRIGCLDVIPRFLDEPANVALLENVRVDEALTALFDLNPYTYPYDAAYFNIGTDSIGGSKLIYDYTAQNLVDFEEAYTTIAYVGDNMDRGKGINANQYIRDLMIAEYAGVFYFDVRSETFKFLHRHHATIAQKDPYIARTSEVIFTQQELTRVRKSMIQVVNEMTVEYFPRKIGGSGSVVASKRNTPFRFRAQETKEFTLRYYDPDNESAQVGAKDVLAPVSGLDVIANRNEDGTGYDWTHFLILKSFRATASEATAVYFNRKVGEGAYVTKFQYRGTPIIAYAREKITVTNNESRYAYDKRTRSETVRLLSTEEEARLYGEFWTGIWANDDVVYDSITIKVTPTSPTWLKEQVIARTIGDRITIRDSHHNDADYMIVGESHFAVATDESIHTVSYIVRPVNLYTPFVIGTSTIGSTDLIII